VPAFSIAFFSIIVGVPILYTFCNFRIANLVIVKNLGAYPTRTAETALGL